MAVRVPVRRPVLEWARIRGGKDLAAMRRKFREWDLWVTEDQHPTVRQAQDLAAYTHVPFGMLLLDTPPGVQLPIPDFRVTGEGTEQPSQDLLDTIYLNQQRQAWFEDYLAKIGAEPLAFVGAAMGATVEAAAEAISDALDYGLDRRATFRTTDDARKHLIRSFERLGGLVVVSSMVGNNTHRMLDRDEFRGFTLQSATAPLVFVNANDTKAGQVFSLLHEFGHVWHGDTGVSVGGEPLTGAGTDIERWCDRVAAEVAVPRHDLRRRFEDDRDLTDELERLATFYRCSTLVVLIRLRDLGTIPTTGFQDLYEAELGRLLRLVSEGGASSGGDFYNNQPFRIGERLSRALVAETRSGATPMTEALRLMAFKSTEVFDSYAGRLESA